jgi:pimeloyl-ACP methyl ester carboxylesterase
LFGYDFALSFADCCSHSFQGTADVFPSFDTSEVVKKYIPNLEFVPIKDGPHDLPTTNPKEVVDALVHFFK